MKNKADDKVEYEKGTKEKFTHFELLQKKVEVLREQVESIVEILKDNDITRQEEIEAEYFNDEELFRRLEEDE